MIKDRHKAVVALNMLLSLLFCVMQPIHAQNNAATIGYRNALDTLKVLIEEDKPQSFKDAVFIVENTFLDNHLDKSWYEKTIEALAIIAKTWLRYNPIKYHASDSINFGLNMAIYKVIKDTVRLDVSPIEKYHTVPYTYDFNDFFGREDWANVSVAKLLLTKKGNCRSLPYLYKLIADELNAICWLSFGPNHIYIKNRSQRAGWYNTELTSGSFPVDAWIATSGYVPIDAIRNGIYMDTLSNQQAIAQCVLDLAKGYEFKTKNYQDGFILKCCDLVLQYHPVNVQALLLKAETLKHVYEANKSKAIYKDMEATYIRLLELGYREMPERMYMQWLKSAIEQKDKFSNKQLN